MISSMLLGTLGASLLGNLWNGWGVYKADKGKGKGVLTNLEIQKYYKNEPRFTVFILEIIYAK